MIIASNRNPHGGEMGGSRDLGFDVGPHSKPLDVHYLAGAQVARLFDPSEHRLGDCLRSR
jgi:hypothetical protein